MGALSGCTDSSTTLIPHALACCVQRLGDKETIMDLEHKVTSAAAAVPQVNPLSSCLVPKAIRAPCKVPCQGAGARLRCSKSTSMKLAADAAVFSQDSD